MASQCVRESLPQGDLYLVDLALQSGHLIGLRNENMKDVSQYLSTPPDHSPCASQMQSHLQTAAGVRAVIGVCEGVLVWARCVGEFPRL